MSRKRWALFVVIALSVLIIVDSSRLRADSEMCAGATVTLPFNDVGSSIFFCQIAEAYFSGLTNGTSPTTFSPSSLVTRDQMAAFMTRTQDSALRRGGRRAALGQWWTTTPRYDGILGGLGSTTVAAGPFLVASDGVDLWVASGGSDAVSRVRGSDGKVLDTWTGATGASGVLVAMGRTFVTGQATPGKLYMIDPTQAGGPAEDVSSSGLGDHPVGIAFDGSKIWTANFGSPGSVSIVTPGPSAAWLVHTVTAGITQPIGILFDGSNIWSTDFGGGGKLLKLNSDGTVSQSVTVGRGPVFPTFDGTNIWVPNSNDDTISVVRASTGTVVATLSGNGLHNPQHAAFDGERILVTSYGAGGTGDGGVSLWKAADLTPIGTFAIGVGAHARGACSDGINFWITLNPSSQLVRF